MTVADDAYAPSSLGEPCSLGFYGRKPDGDWDTIAVLYFPTVKAALASLKKGQG